MSESAFRNSIRSSVRGLWSGALSASQFRSAMQSAIKRNLTNAWTEGARDCGISADELSEDETKALAEFIAEQIGYISGFASAIREGDKVSKGKLQPLFDRSDMWINRYADARERAKSLACGNKKLEWQVGPTEHCRDCLSYNGKVYRANMWGEIRPQSSCLACGGFRCQCKRQVTDKRASRGKPKPMSKC